MSNSYKLPLFIAFCHLPLLWIKTSSNDFKDKKKPILIKTIHFQENSLQTFSKKIAKNSLPQIKKTPKTKIKRKNIVKQKPIRRKKKQTKKFKKISKKQLKKSINKALKTSKKITTQQKIRSKKIQQNRKKSAEKKQSDYNIYLSKISEVFTDFLILPEEGSVTLAITIKEDKVIKIIPISSESSRNLKYLQENLPKLSLPKGILKDCITFNLVFSDEK